MAVSVSPWAREPVSNQPLLHNSIQLITHKLANCKSPHAAAPAPWSAGLSSGARLCSVGLCRRGIVKSLVSAPYYTADRHVNDAMHRGGRWSRRLRSILEEGRQISACVMSCQVRESTPKHEGNCRRQVVRLSSAVNQIKSKREKFFISGHAMFFFFFFDTTPSKKKKGGKVGVNTWKTELDCNWSLDETALYSNRFSFPFHGPSPVRWAHCWFTLTFFFFFNITIYIYKQKKKKKMGTQTLSILINKLG